MEHEAQHQSLLPPIVRNVVIAVAVTLISVEAYLLWRKHKSYPWRDVMISVLITAGLPVSRIIDAAVMGGLYLLATKHHLFNIPNTWWSIAALFVWQEFVFYWLHRAGHTFRWLWASHSVHHTPIEVMLPTAFRLPWTALLQGTWLPLLTSLWLGFDPVASLAVMVGSVMYTYLQHTALIGTLGPLEYILNTPQHHRLHHSAEAQHLDCNFSSCLIIFDQAFGTYNADLQRPKVYGIIGSPPCTTVFSAALGEWKRLLIDLYRAPSPMAAFKIVVGRPYAAAPVRQKYRPSVELAA